MTNKKDPIWFDSKKFPFELVETKSKELIQDTGPDLDFHYIDTKMGKVMVCLNISERRIYAIGYESDD